MALSSSGGQPRAKFEPDDGHTLLFIGQCKESIDRYIHEVGEAPYGIMLYTSVQEANGLDEQDYNNGVVQDGRYVLARHPTVALQIGLYMAGASKGVVEGKYDRNIDKVIGWSKNSRRPVFLRIGYECDWTGNKYEPAEYQAAFRYIVQRARKTRADNLAYVWHSAGGSQNQEPEKWYPGDEYVDWMAVSHFDESPFYMDKMVRLARERGKPLMIAEAAPRGRKMAEGRSVWNFWFKPLLTYINKNDIKGLCYINDPWDEIPMWAGQHWGDSRIEANQDVLAEWRKTIRQDRFNP